MTAAESLPGDRIRTFGRLEKGSGTSTVKERAAWRIAFNEKERTLRVEYDASHLSESAVAGLLRSVGLDLREKLVLT